MTVAGQLSEEKAKSHGIQIKQSGRGLAASLDTIAELLIEKKIQAKVAKVFPLAQAAVAQDLSQSGHDRGRILLKV